MSLKPGDIYYCARHNMILVFFGCWDFAGKHNVPMFEWHCDGELTKVSVIGNLIDEIEKIGRL